MWCLRLRTGETFFRLLCGEEYTVGRKDVQILVDNDASVSRSHALLSVSAVPLDRIDNVSFVPLLRLKDLGSKYGTMLNDARLGANQETVVQNGDTVTFGQLGSSFTVHYERPMVITSSCLPADEKEKLKESVVKLGSRIVSEWSDGCTHLVMSSIRLTVKTTSALIAAKPVVKPTFFHDTLNRVRSKNWDELNTSDYIPDISEEHLTVQKAAFDRNPARKTLFSGKVFYFLDKTQHGKLASMLESGGGRVELVRDPNKPQTVYLEEGSCVFKPSHGIPDHPVCKFLARNKLRAIPESDVALSVAYCSTEKHCNPRSTAAVALWGNSHTLSSQSQAFSQGEVCVPDTEDDSEADRRDRRGTLTARTIPESRPLSTAPAASRVEDIPSMSTAVTTLNGGCRNILTATKGEPSSKMMSEDPNPEPSSQKSPSRLSLSQRLSSRLSLRSSANSPAHSPSESPPGRTLRSARQLRMSSNSPSRPSTSSASKKASSKSPSKSPAESPSKSPSKSPAKSPSKIRKRHARGILPLELYFSPCKKRKEANGMTGQPATKLPRLSEAGDVDQVDADGDSDIEEIDIKDEPRTPPPTDRELQLPEDPTDMELHEMENADEGVVGSGSRLDLAQQMPSCELDGPDWARKDVPDLGPAAAAVIAGTDDEVNDRSMVIVEFENLVLAKSSARDQMVVAADSGPNFKRFKKTNKGQLRGLPKIIGGPDLVVYVPNQPEEVYNDEDPTSQNHADLFNYNPPDPKRRR